MSELSVGQLKGLPVNSNVVTVPSGHTLYAPGHVLQVVSTAKLDTFSSPSPTYVDVTGLSATITPSSSSSKVLVLIDFYGAVGPGNTGDRASFQGAGGNLGTYIGNAAGSRERVAAFLRVTASDVFATEIGQKLSLMYLDSPATTSATTYKLQVKVLSGSIAYVGRSATDSDSAAFPRVASSITLMEIAA